MLCLSVLLAVLTAYQCQADPNAAGNQNLFNSYYQPVEPAVTEKETAFNNKYRQKFDEIFRAYSEGYKAAMIAMQSRSVIPRVPEMTSTIRIPKSAVPKPAVVPGKSKLPAAVQRPNAAGISNQIRSKVPISQPLMRELTVNAIEKSGIPRPLLQALIARRKAQALAKRNQVPAGSVSYLARPNPLVQFLQQQTVKEQMAKRRFEIPHTKVNELDQSAFYDEPRIARQAAEMKAETPTKATVQNPVKKNIAMKNKRNDERNKRSHAPYLGQNLEAFGIVRVEPHLDDKPAVQAKRTMVPKPKPAPVMVKKIDNPMVKRVQIPVPQQDQDSVLQPLPSRRNEIPQYQSFIAMPQITIPQPPVQKESEEEKRDNIARLNAAARRRNVYLDKMGGDPYGGSSGVISGKITFAKHR